MGHEDTLHRKIASMHFWLNLIIYASRADVGQWAGITETTWKVWESDLKLAATIAFHAAKRVS